MTMSLDEAVTQQPLLMDSFHRSRSAKMISFGNWTVPAYYTSIIEEHTWVRSNAGIFDVSHMGEIRITGPDTRPFLQYIISNDVERYAYGTAFYSVVCNERGGMVDDIFVYPVRDDFYFLIVNAANREKDYEWLLEKSSGYDIVITNLSHERAMIAVQGPAADAVISAAFSFDPAALPFHAFCYHTYEGVDMVVSASGYTGERGFEIMADNTDCVRLWQRLIEAGEPHGLKPVGFGARDTLRLEAGCALYGHELSETTLPTEVRLSWIVRMEKAAFIGKEALRTAQENTTRRKLYGIAMCDRAVAREGYEVFSGGEKIGIVTSGSFAPTVGKNIGLVLVKKRDLSKGDTVSVRIRGKDYTAEIVDVPFYRRGR